MQSPPPTFGMAVHLTKNRTPDEQIKYVVKQEGRPYSLKTDDTHNIGRIGSQDIIRITGTGKTDAAGVGAIRSYMQGKTPEGEPAQTGSKIMRAAEDFARSSDTERSLEI